MRCSARVDRVSRINTAAYGGFVIELGDAAEYGDFSVFSKRMQSNQLTGRWDSNNMLLHVEYRSGQDVMEMGCGTDYKAQSEVHRAITPGQQTKAIRYRKINGAWPYLPPGIERDTSLAQQGTTGRLEKNGAVLATGTQRKAYLQTEPISGTYTGYNPLPDPTDWLLTVPGGVNIRANGKVSLLRVSVQPKQNRLWIDYAAKESQCGPDMASHLLVSGMPQQPSVEYNGRRLAERFKSVQVNRDGERAYAVPIVPEKCSMAAARAQR